MKLENYTKTHSFWCSHFWGGISREVPSLEDEDESPGGDISYGEMHAFIVHPDYSFT